MKKTKHKPSKLETRCEAPKKTPGARWYCKVLDEQGSVLQFKPDDAVCIFDQSNGRFLVHHKLHATTRKSNSWTRRGMGMAVKEALTVMWSWECAGGSKCPMPLGMLNPLFD